jgi:MFS transporter, putative metabolite:H+ symporter
MRIATSVRSWLWPSEKPTREERSLILLLGTAFLVSRYDFTLLALALPDIQRDLGVAERDLGEFVAYARLGAVAALPFAMMADRMGRRALLLITIIGFTLCSAATAFVTNWQAFAALQFAARAFTAADEMISVVVILEELAIRRRGWAVGMLAAFGGLGDGLAAALYPLSKALPGEWRALYLLAALPLLLIVYVRRNLKETARFEMVSSGHLAGWRAIRTTLAAQPRKLTALLFVSVAYHIPIAAALSLMSKFLQETHAYTKGQVSILFIGAGAVALLGNLIGGTLTDRIGRRRGFALFCFMMAGGFTVFYNAPTSAVPFAWAFALFAFLASHAVFLAISGEAFPTVSRVTVASLMLAVGSIATAMGLFLEGWLYGLFGNHESAIVCLLPAFVIAGIAALFLLPETSGTELPDHISQGA